MGKNAKRATKRSETYRWLMEENRSGVRRIERLGWKRLAGIYIVNAPGSDTRKAIAAEARNCGYTPSVILGLNS